MGAGKTAVGKALAATLGYQFLDLDEAIERKAGKNIPQIFADEGEHVFRAWERKRLSEAMEGRGAKVIALGGGTFASADNLVLLQLHDILAIFLEAPVEELFRRCVDSLDATSRPLLKDLPSFKKLYAERLAFYERADLRVATAGASVPEVVKRITEQIESLGTKPGRKHR